MTIPGVLYQIGSALFNGSGITNYRGFDALRKKVNKTYGLSVALGTFHTKPCLYEFNVELGRDGWFPGRTTWTGGFHLKIPPRYLKGTNRICYRPGDFIFLQKLKKSTIERGFKTTIEDNRPGALKFFAYILNDGKPKTYKFGYLILNIKSNGDGTGEVEVQPVIFYSDTPKPVSWPRNFGVGGMYSKSTQTDLNALWHSVHTWNSAHANFVSGFNTIVLELTQAAVGGLQKAVAKKILGRFAKKAIKEELSKRLAKGFVKASLAFSKAFVAEIVLQLDKQSGQASPKNIDIKKIIAEKATLKAVGAFLATALSEVSSESIKNLIPEKELEGLSDRLARWFLVKHNAFLIKLTTGLFSLYADKMNLKPGKNSKNLDEKAMDSYQGELKNSYKDLMKELINALSEFALG